MNRRNFFRSVVAGAGALWLPDVARVYSFPSVECVTVYPLGELAGELEEITARYYAELMRRLAEILCVPQSMLDGSSEAFAHEMAKSSARTTIAIRELMLDAEIGS